MDRAGILHAGFPRLSLNSNNDDTSLWNFVPNSGFKKLATAPNYFILPFFVATLQQSGQDQMETCKREVKTLRAELDQLRAADNPYYVIGGDGDDKVDDDDALRRQQQRGPRDWTNVDEQAKVSHSLPTHCRLILSSRDT